MEPLTAFGLAAGILQMVDFSTKTIKTANELRHKSGSTENIEHQALASHLEILSGNIATSLLRVEESSTNASPEEEGLKPVVEGCSELARELLTRLRRCGLAPGKRGLVGRTRTALRCIWNKREIDDIANRLQGFRSQLLLHLSLQTYRQTTRLSPAAQTPAIVPPTPAPATQDDQLQFIILKLNNLELTIQGLKDDHTERQVPQGTSTLESSATVVVDSGSFHAQHLQHLQSDSSLENLAVSLRDVLQPSLEEYKERLLEQVRKEIRGTARGELEGFQQYVAQILAEIHLESTTGYPKARASSPGRSGKRALEEDSPSDEDQRLKLHKASHTTASEDQAIFDLEHSSPSQLTKADVVCTYSKTWFKRTAVGYFYFETKRHVQFTTGLPPRRTVVSTAKFLPELSWITRGGIFQYQSQSDARGWPTISPYLETFRIIPLKHPVWHWIFEGDVKKLQQSLSDGSVVPSDRDGYGRTLLHEAASSGMLEMCRILVNCGAKVAEPENHLLLPEDYALLSALPPYTHKVEIYGFLKTCREQSRHDYSWIEKPASYPSFMLLHLEMLGQHETIRHWMAHCSKEGINMESSDYNNSILWMLAAAGLEDSVPMAGFLGVSVARERYLCASVILRFLAHGVSPNHRTDGYPFLFMIMCRLCATSPSEHSSDEPSDAEGLDKYQFLVEVARMAVMHGADVFYREESGCSISEVCRASEISDIWRDILESCELDPDLVLREDERREMGDVAESSAHEHGGIVRNLGRPAEVARRRPFRCSEDG